MDITKIDKNFIINKENINGKLIEVPSNDVALFGVHYEDKYGFVRLPQELADKVSDGVKWLNNHTAGGRICFSTNSTKFSIHVNYVGLYPMNHMTLKGQAGFALCKVENNEEIHINSFSGGFNDKESFTASCDLHNEKNEMKNYVLHMPLYNPVTNIYLEIDKESVIKPYNPYKDILPIVYYGSSITQGGCANRSDHSYQGFISKWNHIDFVNYGYSGSCKAEDLMIEFFKNIKCSVFVYDYDHNAPTIEHLKQTHEKLFKEFRKTHPTTPVIMISAPDYYYDEKNREARKRVIKKTYLNAIKNNDKNVYFIDGSKFYPKELRYECAVDGCHPTDLGFYYMAKGINKVLNQIFK